MPDVTVNQDLESSDMVTAEDIKDVSFQNHTAAMSALTNGLTTTTNLLDKVSIKKFDQVGILEAKSGQMIGFTPPVQGPLGT